jgi:tetratricopeptide (TPR) repeat protein
MTAQDKESSRSGRSHPQLEGARPPGGKKKVLIAALAVLCVCVASILITRSFRRGEKKPLEAALDDRFVRTELDIEESAKAYNERAVQLAERLVREFPGRAEPLFLLGQVYYEQERYDNALKEWDKALKIDSEQPAAYQAMGLMALQRGDYEAAISHWRKSIEIDPNWPGARRAVGLALMHLQRSQEAVEEFEADLKSSPDDPQTHFLLGQALLQLGNSEEAKKNYESALESNPRFTSAYYGLSRALTRLGQKEAAKEALEKFQQLKAGEQKAKREGEEAYDDIIAQRAGLARTYDRAGMLYREQGDIKKAMNHFQVAAKLDPMNIRSRRNLASLYEQRGEIEKAVGVYEEMSQAHPRDVRPFLSIGAIYARAGRFEDAEKSFNKAIQFAPGLPIGYYELARLYLGTKMKLTVAEALAKKALELEANAATYDLLGWAYYLNGKLAEAEAAASKAVELQPDNLVYREHHETIRAGQ